MAPPIEPPVVLRADSVEKVDGAANELFHLSNEFPIVTSLNMGGIFSRMGTAPMEEETDDYPFSGPDGGFFHTRALIAHGTKSGVESDLTVNIDGVYECNKPVSGVSVQGPLEPTYCYTFLYKHKGEDPYKRLPFKTRTLPLDFEPTESKINVFLQDTFGFDFDTKTILDEKDATGLTYEISIDTKTLKIGNSKDYVTLMFKCEQVLTWLQEKSGSQTDADTILYTRPSEKARGVALRKYDVRSIVKNTDYDVPDQTVLAWYYTFDSDPRIFIAYTEQKVDDKTPEYWKGSIHAVDKENMPEEWTDLHESTLDHFSKYIAKQYNNSMDANLYDVKFIPYTRVENNTSNGKDVVDVYKYKHDDTTKCHVVYKRGESESESGEYNMLRRIGFVPAEYSEYEQSYQVISFMQYKDIHNHITAIKHTLAADSIAQTKVVDMMNYYLAEYAPQLSVRNQTKVHELMLNTDNSLYKHLFSDKQWDEILTKMFEYHQLNWNMDKRVYNQMLAASCFEASVDFVMGIYGRHLSTGALRTQIQINHNIDHQNVYRVDLNGNVGKDPKVRT